MSEKQKLRRLWVQVTRRDFSEKGERVVIEDGMYDELTQRLLGSPEIRAVHVYEQTFYHHKTFAEDFDKFGSKEHMDAMLEALRNAREIPPEERVLPRSQKRNVSDVVNLHNVVKDHFLGEPEGK